MIPIPYIRSPMSPMPDVPVLPDARTIVQHGPAAGTKKGLPGGSPVLETAGITGPAPEQFYRSETSDG
tara:strand:+ start:873 stop:1076 length:204 start_codon:yes stop_codon:yes gene_type:complete